MWFHAQLIQEFQNVNCKHFRLNIDTTYSCYLELTDNLDNTHDCPGKQGRRSDGWEMRLQSRRLFVKLSLPRTERIGES